MRHKFTWRYCGWCEHHQVEFSSRSLIHLLISATVLIPGSFWRWSAKVRDCLHREDTPWVGGYSIGSLATSPGFRTQCPVSRNLLLLILRRRSLLTLLFNVTLKIIRSLFMLHPSRRATCSAVASMLSKHRAGWTPPMLWRLSLWGRQEWRTATGSWRHNCTFLTLMSFLWSWWNSQLSC